MKVSILTPTGGRSRLQPIYDRLISRQTYRGPIEVILVDDVGDVKTTIKNATIVNAKIRWVPGFNTQRFSLEEGLKAVTGDILILAEDDDWISPNYIETVIRSLQVTEAFGIGFARYYNFQVPGYKTNANFLHASLSQTALRSKWIPLLRQAINSGEFYIDIQFWKLLREKKVPYTMLNHTGIAVGMKGLPGRAGLTISHKQKRDYMYDSNLEKLHSWIGEDVELYKQFLPRRAYDSFRLRSAKVPNSHPGKSASSSSTRASLEGLR